MSYLVHDEGEPVTYMPPQKKTPKNTLACVRHRQDPTLELLVSHFIRVVWCTDRLGLIIKYGFQLSLAGHARSVGDSRTAQRRSCWRQEKISSWRPMRALVQRRAARVAGPTLFAGAWPAELSQSQPLGMERGVVAPRPASSLGGQRASECVGLVASFGGRRRYA